MKTLGIGAIVQVGGGRGFIVEMHGERYVVTAAHCLTRPLELLRTIDDANEPAVLPPPMPAMCDTERTYPNLLGPLEGECTVWAQCLFVDPVADIAVLGAAFVREQRALPDGETITLPSQGSMPVLLLSLDQHWFTCRVEYLEHGPLWIAEGSERIEGGVSGSPIVSPDGAAIGLVSTGGGEPNPCLIWHLPGWLVRDAPADGTPSIEGAH